ncbi:MAG: hypothetical protein WBA12_16425, partial [Catalinimonas sp.]
VLPVTSFCRYELSTFFRAAAGALPAPSGGPNAYLEVIADKTFGGDNEAGITDNGQFSKLSLGLVYRQIKTVAIKADVSSHVQQFNGEQRSYPEVRLDFSFGFDALKQQQ